MLISAGQVLQGRYRIDSLIGQGGMSYVYRAEDQRLGRLVAIKVLRSEYCEDEEFIKKFKNEAQAAAKLNHPNIVAAYDVVDEGKLHFIVMEMVEGITLKNYIQRKGRLDNKEAVGIALQVIDGIAQAHRMGIVHRDIKPQNMIVGEDGIVKVADFGIARAATQQTVNATVMGSVHYISPEQARSGIADERSDIYSFGCTLFEMLAGRVPFDGENSVAVVLAHLEAPTPRVRELNPEVYPALDEAVYKCMQKKPERRYQHIEELAEDLRRALTQPEGGFIEETDSREGADETHALSQDEIERIRQKTRTRTDQLIEDMLEESGVEEDEIGDRMSRIYKLIAGGCVALIVVLACVIGGRLLGFIRLDGQESAAPQSSAETARTETEDQINITISVLDTALQNIIGMTPEEAGRELSGYGVKVKQAGDAYSDEYGEGRIISFPKGRYATGDTVEVTVSKGAATLDFSDTAALNATSYKELADELAARGIEAETERAYSDEVEEGNVIAANKPDTSGTEKLVLTVSRGKEPEKVAVPQLLNQTEAEARQLLAGSGLRAGSVTQEPSDAVEAGRVLGQQYAAGTMVEKNTEITFTVSSGPETAPASSEAEGNAPGAVSASAPAEKWYSNINTSCVVGTGGPGATGTVLVSIRLKQYVNNAWRYTELQAPRSYASGTELQVVFGSIEGAPGVESGQVEVVDASDDRVIASFGCKFGPA